MVEIKVEKLSDEELKSLGVNKWSPWECESSTFDWEYDDKETCYVLEGKVKVKTPDGEVEFGKGDLVTFSKGLKCTWNVIEKIRKVYKFG
jgi:hypothetical protein